MPIVGRLIIGQCLISAFLVQIQRYHVIIKWCLYYRYVFKQHIAVYELKHLISAAKDLFHFVRTMEISAVRCYWLWLL